MTDAAAGRGIAIQVEEPTADCRVLRIVGELDMFTSPSLREAINHQLASRPSRLVLDLKDIPFMGTSGLAVLVEARAGSRERGTELWLVCTQRGTLRSLDVAGLRPLFRIADTVPDALSGN